MLYSPSFWITGIKYYSYLEIEPMNESFPSLTMGAQATNKLNLELKYSGFMEEPMKNWVVPSEKPMYAAILSMGLVSLVFSRM